MTGTSVDYHYLDTRHVLELTDGDLSLVQTLLGAYLVAAPEEQLRLQQAIVNHNQPELMQQTHRIRGSLRYLGALPLEVMLQRIESDASASSQELLISYHFFHQACHQLIHEIHHWQQCLMRR